MIHWDVGALQANSHGGRLGSCLAEKSEQSSGELHGRERSKKKKESTKQLKQVNEASSQVERKYCERINTLILNSIERRWELVLSSVFVIHRVWETFLIK